MKREIARFVAKCDICQRVKASHLKPAGTLQPLPIPSWKWEDIGMDFIVGLPKTSQGYDSIWVIVDRLTKSAHFLPVRTSYTYKDYAELYLSRIVCLHGVPKTIVSDRGTQFTSRFWHSLQEALGTKLLHSSAYHPQTGGQVERVNQILEDMLRACVLTYGKRWELCLSFAELSYNNSYQASLQMAPFEALYGRRCRTPLNWSESGKRPFYGPDLVNETEEKVKQVQEHLRIAQSRQKSYVDYRRRPLSFRVGDYVYLKVSPLRGMQRFQVRRKLAPRYVGPFRIVSKRGAVAYELKLPANFPAVFNVFHISQLKKCLHVPEEAVEIDHLDIQPDLTYVEYPLRIVDEAERTTRNRKIKFVKVQWRNHTVEEATWEREENIRRDYPELFATRYVSIHSA